MKAGIWVMAVIVAILVSGTRVQAACVGDCGDDGEVTIDELVLGVNIALGNTQIGQCGVFDGNSDGEVTIDELIAAVNNVLNSCPLAVPTPTATATVPVNTPTPAIVGPGISAEFLGTWSGRAVNESQNIMRNARLKIELVANKVVVTDLDHTVFVSGTQITMSAVTNAPQALISNRTVGGKIETFNLSLVPGTHGLGLAGIYGSTTISFPPTVFSLGLELQKES